MSVWGVIKKNQKTLWNAGTYQAENTSAPSFARCSRRHSGCLKLPYAQESSNYHFFFLQPPYIRCYHNQKKIFWGREYSRNNSS
jgi:hypothetical protein